MVSIGFTGTQSGVSNDRLKKLRRYLRDAKTRGYKYFHHGDCIGADEQAHIIAIDVGLEVIVHPPKVNSKRAFVEDFTQRYPAKDYIARNHDIVDESAILIAMPKDVLNEELRSGTWATVRYAKRLNRIVKLI